MSNTSLQPKQVHDIQINGSGVKNSQKDLHLETANMKPLSNFD